MNKSTLLIGLVVVVIGGAVVGFKFLRPAATSSQSSLFPDASQVPKGAQVVKMRNDDYTPTDFTIPKGTTVVFINESKDYRWPASDLHPTHEIYAEFDPKEPVPPGKSWSFTFDKSGSWKWHDHLVPYLVGTITVSE